MRRLYLAELAARGRLVPDETPRVAVASGASS
jgi:hypothetical protein